MLITNGLHEFTFTSGPPQNFSCQCKCPYLYRHGISVNCTLMWEKLPTVSCSSLQVNVSVTLPDGTLVYSGSFDQSITSTQTTPLNMHTVYTAAITGVCGATCSVNCSTVPIYGKKLGMEVVC